MTLKQLQKRATIYQGQTDDCKYANGKMRIWVSRMTKEDGMKTDNEISIERLVDGKWINTGC